jgi:hypothetical protein
MGVENYECPIDSETFDKMPGLRFHKSSGTFLEYPKDKLFVKKDG